MASRKSTEFVQLKLRVRQDLRRRLEREAKKGDRSVNNEAVARIENSFDQEARADEILGGPAQAALLRLFASHLDLARARHGSDLGEPEALKVLTSAIRDVLEQIVPTLHSVKIALCAPDSGSELSSFTSLSEKAWASMVAIDREIEGTKP